MVSHHGTPPPADHSCTQQEMMQRIDQKLDLVLDRLAAGDTAIALLEHRLAFVEKIVYGLCGFILLAVLAGVVALVVRAAP